MSSRGAGREGEKSYCDLYNTEEEDPHIQLTQMSLGLKTCFQENRVAMEEVEKAFLLFFFDIV